MKETSKIVVISSKCICMKILMEVMRDKNNIPSRNYNRLPTY